MEFNVLDDLEKLLKTDKKIAAVSAVTAAKNEDEIISTGLLPLDINLGGGISRGSIMSIYGPASNGKSTLCDSIVASWLKSNPNALVYRVESERCMDINRLQRIGVDITRVKVLEKDKSLILEECFEQIEKFQDLIYEHYGDKVPVLIVWDTISAAVAKTVAEGETFGSGMMIDARIITQGLRKLNARCANYKHSCILLQQVMSGGKDRMGNEIFKTSDVQAYKHVPSAILEVRRSTGKDRQIYNPNSADPRNPEVIGSEVDVKIRKNKLTGLDSRAVSLVMYMTSGFSKMDSLILYATNSGVCSKYFSGSGAWIQVYDHKGNELIKVNGKAKLAEEIKNNPYLIKLIEWAGYKYFSDQDDLYKAKYANKLDRLEKELDKLLEDKNSVKVDMSGLSDLGLPEDFGNIPEDTSTDDE